MIATQASNRWNVLVGAQQTGGRFAVIETVQCHGAAPPRHIHTREDELIYVLEGHVSFERDGESLDGPAGTWLFLPRGSEHTFAVQSEEARLLVLLAPAGLEDSIGELARPADPVDNPPLVEKLVATAARYGVSITGPGRRATGEMSSPTLRS